MKFFRIKFFMGNKPQKRNCLSTQINSIRKTKNNSKIFQNFLISKIKMLNILISSSKHFSILIETILTVLFKNLEKSIHASGN
jgi:hypothetical protein